MRCRFGTLVLAMFAVAMPLTAHALELVSPAKGVTLRGATIAVVEWKSGTLPKGAEEWEAFLSIDGGKYYGYRITPHLEIGIRRFSFVVPNVDTANARIMIRTGDEARETRFEIPASFSITRDRHAAARLHAIVAHGRAESARDGDPAVLEWAEGSRDGSGLRERAADAAPKTAFVSATATEEGTQSTLAPDSLPLSLRSLPEHRLACSTTSPFAADTAPRVLDLLLVCRRLNI